MNPQFDLKLCNSNFGFNPCNQDERIQSVNPDHGFNPN